MHLSKEKHTILEQFVLVEKCGEGAYSTVYKVKNVITDKFFALKEIEVTTNEGAHKAMNEDIRLYGHANIRKYFGLFTSRKLEILEDGEYDKSKPIFYTYLLSDYCEYTLRDFINYRNEVFFDDNTNVPDFVHYSLAINEGTKKVNRKYIFQMFKGVVKGVLYLHQNKKMHRDLKPENIFLKSNVPKIGDFGFVKEISDMFDSSQEVSNTMEVGTETYAAPELNCGHYNQKVDVYSLGLVYFEMLYPLNTQMERALVIEKIKFKGEFPDDFYSRFPFETYVIEKCLKRNPSQRFNSRKLLDALVTLGKFYKCN